jgi:two-component system, cell cycle sensor histidine kinase and response regulator CckA
MGRRVDHQLARLGLSEASPPDEARWRAFLDDVEHTYSEEEEDRQTLERVLELSSGEMWRLHDGLAQSEANYRVIVERSPDAMFVSREGTIRYANPAMAELLGYGSAAELVGLRPIATFVHPDDRPRLIAHRTARDAGGPVGAIEVRWVRQDGQILTVRGVSTHITHEREPALLTISRDVTEKLRAERERQEAQRFLRLSEERYRVLFEASPLPILLFDPESVRILAANDAAVMLYGYSREELLAMCVTALKVEKDDPDLIQCCEAARGLRARGPGPRRLSKKHRKKDGAVFDIDITSHPVTVDGRVALLSIGIETTETRRLEAQLRQAQKMEAIGQLAGGVAHDFNNVLATILSYADLAAEELGKDHVITPDLRQIGDAAKRAAALTRQLLTFSRQQATQTKRLSLNKVVLGLEGMLRRLIGEDIAVSTALADGLDLVEADPGQLDQVLLNLAVNARDAMKTGGKILIETANVVMDAPLPEVDVPPGRYVMLSVRDTGCGMDAATQARIFEPFFTTKEVGKGTGLGLSTVYGIVKQSGGGLKVESAPGEGSTFRVYLPQVPANGESIPAAPLVASRPSPATVLLVEDDEQVRNVVDRLLRARGYEVLAVANGAMALEALVKRGRGVDLILTDVVMPEMDGRTMAKKALEIHPRMRVLYMSGYTEHPGVKGAALGPADHFIQKPFTVQQMADAVRSALEGGALPLA